MARRAFRSLGGIAAQARTVKRRTMHPAAAREAIRAGAREAVARAHRCTVPMPDRFETDVTFHDHKLAYRRSFYPGAVRQNSTTIRFETADWYEMLRFYHFVLP